jgi:hypothetical protein
MNNDYIFRSFLFPHLHSKSQQRKELSFVHCLNIRMVDNSRSNNVEADAYLRSILYFIRQADNARLIKNDNKNIQAKSKAFKSMLLEKEADVSIFFDVKLIQQEEKNSIDEYLAITNYSKPMDRFAYVYEGCQHDSKVFLGGKKDMVTYYCKLLPKSDLCQKILHQSGSNIVNKQLHTVFDDTSRADKFFEGMIKGIEVEYNKSDKFI